MTFSSQRPEHEKSESVNYIRYLCEFTDNQSQGQTVLCVFVDIATPLTYRWPDRFSFPSVRIVEKFRAGPTILLRDFDDENNTTAFRLKKTICCPRTTTRQNKTRDGFRKGL